MRTVVKGAPVRVGAAARLWFAATLLCLALLPSRARGEGISGYVEYVVSRTETESGDATGTRSRTELDTLLQRYNLTFNKRLYPNLRLLAGGLFEKNDASGSTETGTSAQDVDSTTTKLRPFADLTLSTPLYQASAAYSRGEDTQSSQGAPRLTLIRDQYSGTLGWHPDGFPSLRFQYSRTDDRDEERALRDQTNQTYQLTAQYRPVPPLFLYYQGNLGETEDRLNNNEIRNLSHNGRASYAGQWWNRRVSLGTDYNVSYREVETRAGGEGELVLPLLPLAGLSEIDDTPAQGALHANPALVDGNLQAGSGINLGLAPPGGDTRQRNVGLDFGVATDVNTLFVRIDRELPQPVADSFSWDVYASSDNLTWVLRQTVTPAALDPFVPRFEIRFANVSARFLKVVTRPLSPTVPQATDFPVIQVTELQAALISAAASVEGTRESTSHIYNLTVRTRILNVPALTYELSYSIAAATGAPSRWLLSNGFFASHPFSRSVSGSARVAREDARDAGQSRTGYVFTGALEAVPLPTLRHSLLLSGRTDSTDGRNSRILSLFLYNSAALYKGVDVNLALGGSRNVAENGQTTDTTQADASASIVPHRRVTLGLTYSDRRDVISGGDSPAKRTVTTRSAEGSVAIYPVDTVYLNGSYRVEEPEGEERRHISDYSASWSPFPGGKVHLSFLYSETLRSEDNERARRITPSLRLDLPRGSFFTVAYQKTTTHSDIQGTDSETISGDLRIAF